MIEGVQSRIHIVKKTSFDSSVMKVRSSPHCGICLPIRPYKLEAQGASESYWSRLRGIYTEVYGRVSTLDRIETAALQRDGVSVSAKKRQV